jgi:seryl-tRNA synthetase
MLDIKWLSENMDYAKKNLGQRNFDLSLLDKVIDLNNQRKDLIKKVEESRAEINKLSKEVGALKSKGQDATNVMNTVADLKKGMAGNEENLKVKEEELELSLQYIPNVLSDEVPSGKDETFNKEVYQFGKIPEFAFPVQDHVAIGERLKMLDFDSAALMTGARFVVLKGALARLERALANFMIDYHLARGYQEVAPPYIVHAKSLVGTGQLPKFKEDVFKLEGQDWYLIPTSEVPLTNIKREQLFSDKELPLKYVAYTPCFRSEAGSHGKDTRGLIRMHQFNKVEMVQITTEEGSIAAHEEMIKSASGILQELGLTHRALMLCSGDTGFGSRKTIDLEVWLPAQGKYREISSVSNCWDFQARRASIRYKDAAGKIKFAHTLNGSGLAVGRTLVAILENYQQADGSVKVPEKLVPYMGGMTKIANS